MPVPTPRMRLHVLASGSKGNAAIVEHIESGEGILIDCGLCKREFLARVDGAGFDVTRLKAIVISHDHTDHTKGLGVVLRGLAKRDIHPVVLASAPLQEAIEEIKCVRDADLCPVQRMDADVPLTFASIRIEPFHTSHDACDSFGFRLTSEDDAIGFMTDTGVVPDGARERLAGARILAIEANHDEKMLEDGPYPFELKRRVRSERGHLSNTQAAALVGMLAHGGLEHVIAMHISENNNTYALARETLAGALAVSGYTVKTHAAFQHRAISV